MPDLGPSHHPPMADLKMSHLDHHNILTDAQHGFRKQQFCESQLILTVREIPAGCNPSRFLKGI